MLKIDNKFEYCAWEISHDKIQGIKFVNIAHIDDDIIYGFYYNRFGIQRVRFSHKTGKQFRPIHKNEYLWLTERIVNRKKIFINVEGTDYVEQKN